MSNIPGLPVVINTEFDILKLSKVIELVGELLNQGYGEVNFRVVVQGKKITLLSIGKTETIKIDNESGKEVV